MKIITGQDRADSGSSKVGTDSDTTVGGAILCAGFGSRLRPITEHIAKPAVPFLGIPLAAYSLYALECAKIKHVAVNTHYKAQSVRESLQNCAYYSGDLRFYHEDGEILGTGGGFRELHRCLGAPRTTVLCHGDVLSRVDIGKALAVHRSAGAMVSLALVPRDEEQDLGRVFCDALGNLVGLRQERAAQFVAPLHELAFTGIHFIESQLLEFIPQTGDCCLVTEVYPELLRRGIEINPIIGTQFLADVGSPERYLRAMRACLAQERIVSRPAVADLDEIEIAGSAEIVQPVYLQGKIRVGANCVLGPNVSLCGEISCGDGICVRDASVFGSGALLQNVEQSVCYLREGGAICAHANA